MHRMTSTLSCNHFFHFEYSLYSAAPPNTNTGTIKSAGTSARSVVGVSRVRSRFCALSAAWRWSERRPALGEGGVVAMVVWRVMVVLVAVVVVFWYSPLRIRASRL